MKFLINSEFYLKDFIKSLKGPHLFYFSTASFGFFLSFIFSNPLFFKIFFVNLNVFNFIKEHSFLINIVSIIGQLLFISAIFLYYSSFFKYRTIAQNVKIFVSASITANLFFFITTFLPAVFVYIVLNAIKVEKYISIIAAVFLFLIIASYTLYLIPYFYGKALLESKRIFDAVKIFISAINFKTYFSFLKNKEYLKITFNVSFFPIVFMMFLFILAVFSYIKMITTFNKSFFCTMFIVNNILNSIAYALASYIIIYVSLETYKNCKKQANKTEKTIERF